MATIISGTSSEQPKVSHRKDLSAPVALLDLRPRKIFKTVGMSPSVPLACAALLMNQPAF
jgi:hypothetical protein